MKYAKIYMMSLLALGALMASCDDVSEADRKIPVEQIEANKNVLIMEFTGQTCPNCPYGAQTVHSLQETYPGQVIAINMHPQNTAYTNPPAVYDIGLTSEIATIYYDYYKPVAFPAAIIDGEAPNNNISGWSAEVIKNFNNSTPLELSATTEYDAATRKLDVTYTADFINPTGDEISIVAWVMENDIVGFQLNGSKPDLKYVHNHVMRAAINGTWGDKIGTGFLPGDKVQNTVSITLSEGWKAENCQVVIAAFNAGKAVLQAAEANVTK